MGPPAAAADPKPKKEKKEAAAAAAAEPTPAAAAKPAGAEAKPKEEPASKESAAAAVAAKKRKSDGGEPAAAAAAKKKLAAAAKAEPAAAVAAAAAGAKVKRERKEFDLPGQTRETPIESDGMRKFYASLLQQNPESEMAKKWCCMVRRAHGGVAWRCWLLHAVAAWSWGRSASWWGVWFDPVSRSRTLKEQRS